MLNSLEPIPIHCILSNMPRGSSRPVLAEDIHGEKYVVKLRHSLSNPYAAVCESIASGIASALDIPILEQCIVSISEHTDVQAVTDEMRDTVRKSCGLNFATRYVEKAKDIPAEEIVAGTAIFRDLFLLDIALLNVDRTSMSTNLLRAGQRIISFDYETSLTIIAGVSGKEPNATSTVLKCLRQSTLYTPDISNDEIHAFSRRAQEVSVVSILQQVPTEWLEQDTGERQRALEQTWKMASSATTLTRIYSQVSAAEVESPASYRERVRANRLKFGELLKSKGFT